MYLPSAQRMVVLCRRFVPCTTGGIQEILTESNVVAVTFTSVGCSVPEVMVTMVLQGNHSDSGGGLLVGSVRERFISFPGGSCSKNSSVTAVTLTYDHTITN